VIPAIYALVKEFGVRRERAKAVPQAKRVNYPPRVMNPEPRGGVR
jgi:hypothetical protein